MITISTDKQVILADGIDVANVRFLGDTADPISYLVNGVAYVDAPQLLRSGYVLSIEITCDTQNLPIVIEHGLQKIIIYCAGVF